MVTAARITTLSAAAVILLGLLATTALPPMRSEDERDQEEALRVRPSPAGAPE
jgi:hypothetical protein